MNKLIFVPILFGFLFSCKPQNNDQAIPGPATSSVDCSKPKNLNFKSILFTDPAGTPYYYAKDPKLNDPGDDWKTNKVIPCYFKNLMDSSHNIASDSTIANDTVNFLSAYSNPAETGVFSFIVNIRKPALLHILLVDEMSNVIYSKNEMISQKNYTNNRMEGLEDPHKGYNLLLTIDLNSNPKYKKGSYYRLYYYLSAKNNKCYNQGYGDIYAGRFFNF